jgi:GNAT superfamily N-acetyltransferase
VAEPVIARGEATLVASWAAFARGAREAAVERLPGATAALFPHEPERSVFNNALVEPGADVPALEAAYAARGIDRFAAWVHEDDGASRTDLERRGYDRDTTTRAMAMALDDARLPSPDPRVVPAGWPDHLAHLVRVGVPEGLLAGADGAAFHVVDGVGGAATGIAFDHDGDCGIFNVGTLEPARRRGLGTAVTAALLRGARERGCRTASLQATPVAERLYAALGFRDFGRYLEFTPPAAHARTAR